MKNDGMGVEGQARVDRRGLLALSALTGTAAILGTTSAKAQGGGKLQEILARGKLIVGTGSTNPPWHFEDEGGKLVGMDADMARLVAKGLFGDPEKIEFVRQESDARIPSLVTGKVDIVFQFLTVTAGRAQQVAFTIPYYREGVTLLMLADSKYETVEQFKAAGSSAHVAGMHNVYIADWIHMPLPEATVDQFDSAAACMQALNSGRVDAYCVDQSTARWLMAQFPGRYRTAGYDWMPNMYSAAVALGDQIWLNYVNCVLQDAMTGIEFSAYSAAFKKWLGEDLPLPTVGFPMEYTPKTKT